MTVTIESIVARWESAERPLFKGQLIDDDCAVCAQGDCLRVAGYTDKQLREMSQSFADAEVAKLLGISRSHAVLLRIVNDRQNGCPQDVLAHPEKVLGPEAPKILAFWRMLDRVTPEEWDAARAAAWDAARDAARPAAWTAAWTAAWDAARAAAWDAAWDAARDAAWDAAWTAAWTAARAAARAAAWTAARASNEIQGAAILAEKGMEPYFLKIFGVNSWEEVANLESRL